MIQSLSQNNEMQQTNALQSDLYQNKISKSAQNIANKNVTLVSNTFYSKPCKYQPTDANFRKIYNEYQRDEQIFMNIQYNLKDILKNDKIVQKTNETLNCSKQDEKTPQLSLNMRSSIKTTENILTLPKQTDSEEKKENKQEPYMNIQFEIIENEIIRSPRESGNTSQYQFNYQDTFSTQPFKTQLPLHERKSIAFNQLNSSSIIKEHIPCLENSTQLCDSSLLSNNLDNVQVKMKIVNDSSDQILQKYLQSPNKEQTQTKECQTETQKGDIESLFNEQRNVDKKQLTQIYYNDLQEESLLSNSIYFGRNRLQTSPSRVARDKQVKIHSTKYINEKKTNHQNLLIKNASVEWCENGFIDQNQNNSEKYDQLTRNRSNYSFTTQINEFITTPVSKQNFIAQLNDIQPTTQAFKYPSFSPILRNIKNHSNSPKNDQPLQMNFLADKRLYSKILKRSPQKGHNQSRKFNNKQTIRAKSSLKPCDQINIDSFEPIFYNTFHQNKQKNFNSTKIQGLPNNINKIEMFDSPSKILPNSKNDHSFQQFLSELHEKNVQSSKNNSQYNISQYATTFVSPMKTGKHKSLNQTIDQVTPKNVRVVNICVVHNYVEFVSMLITNKIIISKNQLYNENQKNNDQHHFKRINHSSPVAKIVDNIKICQQVSEIESYPLKNRIPYNLLKNIADISFTLREIAIPRVNKLLSMSEIIEGSSDNQQILISLPQILMRVNSLENSPTYSQYKYIYSDNLTLLTNIFQIKESLSLLIISKQEFKPHGMTSHLQNNFNFDSKQKHGNQTQFISNSRPIKQSCFLNVTTNYKDISLKIYIPTNNKSFSVRNNQTCDQIPSILQISRSVKSRMKNNKDEMEYSKQNFHKLSEPKVKQEGVLNQHQNHTPKQESLLQIPSRTISKYTSDEKTNDLSSINKAKTPDNKISSFIFYQEGQQHIIQKIIEMSPQQKNESIGINYIKSLPQPQTFTDQINNHDQSQNPNIIWPQTQENIQIPKKSNLNPQFAQPSKNITEQKLSKKYCFTPQNTKRKTKVSLLIPNNYNISPFRQTNSCQGQRSVVSAEQSQENEIKCNLINPTSNQENNNSQISFLNINTISFPITANPKYSTSTPKQSYVQLKSMPVESDNKIEKNSSRKDKLVQKLHDIKQFKRENAMEIFRNTFGIIKESDLMNYLSLSIEENFNYGNLKDLFLDFLCMSRINEGIFDTNCQEILDIFDIKQRLDEIFKDRLLVQFSTLHKQYSQIRKIQNKHCIDAIIYISTRSNRNDENWSPSSLQNKLFNWKNFIKFHRLFVEQRWEIQEQKTLFLSKVLLPYPYSEEKIDYNHFLGNLADLFVKNELLLKNMQTYFYCCSQINPKGKQYLMFEMARKLLSHESLITLQDEILQTILN